MHSTDPLSASKEVSNLMKQLNQSRKASHLSSSLNTYTGDSRKQQSIPADRSFFRQLRERRKKDVELSYEEEYQEVAGVLILATQMRVPQSRLEGERFPGMSRPRMRTI